MSFHMKRVLLSQSIDEAGMKLMRGKVEIIITPDTSGAIMGKLCKNVHGIILRTTSQVNKDVIREAKSLQIVSRTGAGVDNVDVRAATKEGILVGKMIGGKYCDKWNPKKVITVAFLTTSLSLFLVPLVSSFSLILVLLFAGFTLFMALPALVFLISELETTDLGLAYGIQLLIGNGAGALSQFLCGLVGDILGIEYIFFLLSAVAFSGGIFLYFFFNQTNYQSVPS